MYTSFTNKSMPVKPAPEIPPIQRIRLRFRLCNLPYGLKNRYYRIKKTCIENCFTVRLLP